MQLITFNITCSKLRMLLFTVTTVWNTGETVDINTVLCPFKVSSNTIELTVQTSCYCVSDLLCVNS